MKELIIICLIVCGFLALSLIGTSIIFWKEIKKIKMVLFSILSNGKEKR